jgi:hypothetical protein
VQLGRLNFHLRDIRYLRHTDSRRCSKKEETQMVKSVVNRHLRLAASFIVGFVALAGRSFPQSSASSAGTEFPVVMKQNIAAGKTLVGTKVQAKLVAATLVKGVVVPRDAILTGEVTESVKKSGPAPSRLSIRMDSAEWKKGSAPIKVYLTAWYYPEAATQNQDLSYQPPDAASSNRNWNGMGTYPDPNNPISQRKFPAGDSNGGSNKDAGSGAASPASSIAHHRILIKNVQSVRNGDGAVVLIDPHSDLKLDKVTTYVLTADDLAAAK